MAVMIKYELKKIFQNKLFIVILSISLVGMIIFSAVSLGQYRSGTRGVYELSDMKGTKMPEVFVSSDNIGELRKKLADFENNDDIYEKYDASSPTYSNGGTTYSGKYGINTQKQYLRVEKGEITDSEFEKILTDSMSDYVIKKEYLPEYFKLYQPVSEYDSKLITIEKYDIYAKKAEDDYHRAYYTFWKSLTDNEIKNGFTVGYDYGWDNIFSSLSTQSGILLAVVVIFGLCNVFTGEYAGNVDALLLSSKKGKRTAVSAKLLSSLIYTFICWFVYILMTVIVNFAFLGAEGANVGDLQSNISRFFCITPCILLGCVLLGLVTLAVSSLTSKQIPSIALSAIIGLLPLGGAILANSNGLISCIEAMPVNMIFGSYIDNNNYFYLNGSFHDIRILFIPVAISVIIICIPIIYAAYCRHQVKN